MTEPRKLFNIDSVTSAEVRAGVVYRAALAVVARYPDDPLGALKSSRE